MDGPQMAAHLPAPGACWFDAPSGTACYRYFEYHSSISADHDPLFSRGSSGLGTGDHSGDAACEPVLAHPALTQSLSGSRVSQTGRTGASLSTTCGPASTPSSLASRGP